MCLGLGFLCAAYSLLSVNSALILSFHQRIPGPLPGLWSLMTGRCLPLADI
jgi:hypothetical protein